MSVQLTGVIVTCISLGGVLDGFVPLNRGKPWGLLLVLTHP